MVNDEERLKIIKDYESEKKRLKEEKKLKLQNIPGKEGLKFGTKSNGVIYSVRDDRSRYFFPDEWNNFYNCLRKTKQLIFDILIGTGGRVEEIINIKVRDWEDDRKTLTLVVTKTKAAKGERMGKKRTFVVSTELIKKVKKYISKKNLTREDYLFSSSNNKTKPVNKRSVYKLFKRNLKKSGIKDPWNFSLHNIRKTHGNYLKALGMDSAEICFRLGHDMNTYLKHYGSASIFDRKDKQGMIKILGDVYGFK